MHLASFVLDILLAFATATSTGIAPILVLAFMYITTITIAIAAYAGLLPLKQPLRLTARTGPR